MLPMRVLRGLPVEGFTRDAFFEPLRRAEAILFPDARGGDMAMNVRETDSAYIIEAEVPGFGKDQIVIGLDDGVLTLTAEMAETTEKQGETYHIRERRSGKFARSVRLPEVADTSATNATLKDGVLTVTVAKAENAKPRTIEVTEG